MRPTLTHLALHVEQLERCLEFYLDFCQLIIVHRRQHHDTEVVWLAEQGKEQQFVLVLLKGGHRQQLATDDFSHLGFAVASKEEVDSIAAKAKVAGILVWPASQHPSPVGYYCGLVDPNGNYVEFSYGQPLGPGADQQNFNQVF
ncbi:MAG: VOC family protein [Gammaproteobacteria bacterium]|nr:VOC family protein [Gammaproteobacteria bacterium]